MYWPQLVQAREVPLTDSAESLLGKGPPLRHAYLDIGAVLPLFRLAGRTGRLFVALVKHLAPPLSQQHRLVAAGGSRR